MIESKLKAKNCKLRTAVSTWLGLVSRVCATQNRTTSRKDCELSMKLCARGDGDPDRLKSKCLPIEHRHTKRVTMTQKTKNLKYHVAGWIRKVRIGKTILALKTWAKPCENVQLIGSKKTYGPNKTESEN